MPAGRTISQKLGATTAGQANLYHNKHGMLCARSELTTSLQISYSSPKNRNLLISFRDHADMVEKGRE